MRRQGERKMEFDIGTVLHVASLVLANPFLLGGVVGLFLGWNLPQPAFAKMLQEKVVALLSALWNKFRSNDSV